MTSCETFKKPLQIQTINQKVLLQKYTLPEQLTTPNLELEVVTPQIVEQWQQKIDRGELEPYAYYAINERDYLLLSQFLQDVIKYIRKLREINDRYQIAVDKNNE